MFVFALHRSPTTDHRLLPVLLLLIITGCGVAAGRKPATETRPVVRGFLTQTAEPLHPPLTVLWKLKLYAPLLAPPVESNGMLYLAMPNHSVYRVDAQNGVQSTVSKVDGVAQAAPVVRTDVLFIALSGRAGRDQTELLAIDLRQNRMKWRRPIAASWSSPTLVDETLYIGAEDGALYAISTETGEVRWRFMTKRQIHSSPTVANGLVFVGSNDHHLYALDAGTGALRWSFRTGGSIFAAPVAVDSTVYVGSYDRSLYSLDAATGRLRWRFTTGGSLYGSPVVQNGRVFLGSNDRNLYCLDATTGALIWHYTTNGILRSSPLLVGPTVYVGSSDRRLYAIDAASGSLLWDYETEGSITVSPIAVDGLLLVGSEDRYLYAFTAATR